MATTASPPNAGEDVAMITNRRASRRCADSSATSLRWDGRPSTSSADGCASTIAPSSATSRSTVSFTSTPPRKNYGSRPLPRRSRTHQLFSRLPPGAAPSHSIRDRSSSCIIASPLNAISKPSSTTSCALARRAASRTPPADCDDCCVERPISPPSTPTNLYASPPPNRTPRKNLDFPTPGGLQRFRKLCAIQTLIRRRHTIGDATDAVDIPALVRLNTSLEGCTQKFKNAHPPTALACLIVAELGGWSGYISRGYKPRPQDNASWTDPLQKASIAHGSDSVRIASGRAQWKWRVAFSCLFAPRVNLYHHLMRWFQRSRMDVWLALLMNSLRWEHHDYLP